MAAASYVEAFTDELPYKLREVEVLQEFAHAVGVEITFLVSAVVWYTRLLICIRWDLIL